MKSGFIVALIASAALHAALLPLLFSFAPGTQPAAGGPTAENPVQAFLVEGPLPDAVKRLPPDTRGPRSPGVGLPATAALPRIPAAISPTAPAVQPLPDAVGTPPQTESPAPPAGVGSAVQVPIAEPAAGGLPAAARGTPSPTASPSSAPAISAASGPPGNRRGATAAERGSDSPERVGTAARQRGIAAAAQHHDAASPPLEAAATPRYRENRRPDYPPLARLRGYQGVVLLIVEVLADGRVGQVEIGRSAGHEVLDRAALETVRGWTFEPGRKGGQAVKMKVEVPVRFVLNEEPAG